MAEISVSEATRAGTVFVGGNGLQEPHQGESTVKMFASLLLMLVLATAAWGQSGTGTDHDDFNLDKNGLAL
jgi:hypothetical protein